MMDEIDVERIARLRKVELFSVRTVVIRLQLNVGPRTQDSLPTTQQVATGKLRILLHIGHKRRRVTCDPHTLSGITVIEVTLKRELVAIVSIPIRPESGLAHPPVIELFLIGMELGTSREGLPVDAVIEAFPPPGTVPEIDKALVDISTAGRCEHSLGIFGVLRNDIDHTVDSIGSPNGSARASNDFDPFDIFKQCVLDLPINASEERGVHGSAVDQHEYRSGESTPESAHTE